MPASSQKPTPINTGTMCHLDAQMVREACRKRDPRGGAVVLIENVGNLVCLALSDLGESAKVVIASVPEGDDKLAKSPYMFQAASLVILNKCDLLPYVSFDADRFVLTTCQVNPGAQVIGVSVTRGDGLDAWYRWLGERRDSMVRRLNRHGAGSVIHAAGGSRVMGSRG